MKAFTIVRGLFDTRKRSLIIDENYIKFENKDQNNDLFTTINKEDIAGIRYGIHFIKGHSFLSETNQTKNLKYSLNFSTEEN